MKDLPAVLAALPVASPLSFALNERRCLALNLSASNPQFTGFDPADTPRFSAWMREQIAQAGAEYAAGGYGENRALYAMSPVFQAGHRGEPRTLHLGIDLWLAAGTAVHAVVGGRVHSTQDNPAFGDYGPTLILEHEADGQRFYTLYGHLARETLALTQAGQSVSTGQHLGWLGAEEVNVGWPPHLHFQIMRSMDGRWGDHPGVCAPSERAHWLHQCPDPNLLLRIAALGA